MECGIRVLRTKNAYSNSFLRDTKKTFFSNIQQECFLFHFHFSVLYVFIYMQHLYKYRTEH